MAPLTAVLLVVGMVALMVALMFVLSGASILIQRSQDRRLTRAPSRFEWVKVELSSWLRAIWDVFRRRV